MELEEGVLVLRRIHVYFTLQGVDAGAVAAARRAHEIFKPKCPIYRSIHRAIDVMTELQIGGPDGPPPPASSA